MSNISRPGGQINQPGRPMGGPMGGMRRGPGGMHLGRPVEKAKNFRGTLKRLLGYLKPRKMTLILVFVLAIFSTTFGIAAPKISALAINKLSDGFIARMAINQLSDMQKKLTEQMKVQTGTVQGKPDTDIQLTPDHLKTLQEIAKIPVISDIKDADQKADNVEKLAGLLKSVPGIEDGKNFTSDQLENAVRAIRKTNGVIDLKYVGFILLLLLGLYVISSLFNFTTHWVMASVAQKTVYDMRKDLDNKLARLPLKYFDGRTHGEILSRMTNDIDTISQTLQQSMTQLISSIVTIIGIIIMMLVTSPLLTLIVLATVPLYVLVTGIIAKKSQKFYKSQQKELGELSGHVEEIYTGHKIVKAYGREKDSIERFMDINDRLYDAGWKAQFMSSVMWPLMGFISNLGYVVVCVAGGIFATGNMLSIGDISAFIQYARQFNMPIINTANIANIIQSTVACAERVFEVLDEEEELPDSSDAVVLECPKGSVDFRNVIFSYKDTEPLITGLNLNLRQGDTIAIVGPTGAGKTTLVNLLMRFYEINGGKITVDGTDIRDIKRGALRSMFGMVLQDTWLFNGTIKDNIAYGRKGATMEEIVAAAKAAHADHFIRTLPEGYNTVLNEEATNISQGQKQLLTIARAVLADPSILILDEATSSVDTRTEVLIQKAMAGLMKGRTSFVIAHRLSTIRDAEVILVMNHGSIIEQGNHKELIKKGGFYADLYNSQFAGAKI